MKAKSYRDLDIYQESFGLAMKLHGVFLRATSN
jgi:hypothetical protein